MNLKPYFSIAVVCACFSIQIHAQDSYVAQVKKQDSVKHQMNFIKVNLMGLPIKNFSFQYERVLSIVISVAVSYRFMPTSKIPFATSIANSASSNNSQDTKDAIEKLRMSNFAITPEIRFYLGKGYGKGFYIGLFYRYTSFTVDHFAISYDDVNDLDMNGKLTTNTGGILFGAQWSLGKHLCLDWQIFGPHYGSGKGILSGISSQPLTPTQQNTLKTNLDDIDIPLTTKTVAVNATGGSLTLSGPWAGMRSALCLGFKF